MKKRLWDIRVRRDLRAQNDNRKLLIFNIKYFLCGFLRASKKETLLDT
jgi:hypothetical protein